MPTTTSRLSLVQWIGADTPSVMRTGNATNTTTLDAATLYTEGTLVNLPAVGTVERGHLYRATDKNTLQYSNGSVWASMGLTLPTAATTSSAAIVSGQMLNCNGGITITLPTPAQNSVVGIWANPTVTGASPTTVSGTSIFGVGLAAGGASSFTLGAIGAYAILQSDGSNWLIISGQQDSGWVALTPNGAATQVGGAYTFGARTQADKVTLRGALSFAAGFAPGTTLATLPVGQRPTSTAYVDSANGVLNISSAGVINNLSASNGQTCGFDGLSFGTS